MKSLRGEVVCVYVGAKDVLAKEPRGSIDVEFDGIVGDRHRSYTRECWEGDKQVEGTTRRNERQWSAVSVEELDQISKDMDLTEPLTGAIVGANLCIRGVPEFSKLPKGTVFKFPSGAELMVEEYNPPCSDMSRKISETHEMNSGSDLSFAAFSQASALTRGLVGVVEVPGRISDGDEIEINIFEIPKWMRRDSS